MNENWSVKTACVMPPGVVKKNGGGVLKLFPLFAGVQVAGLLPDLAKAGDDDRAGAGSSESAAADDIAAHAKQVAESSSEAVASASPMATPTKMARKLSSGAIKAIKSASSQKNTCLLGRKLPPSKRR